MIYFSPPQNVVAKDCRSFSEKISFFNFPCFGACGCFGDMVTCKQSTTLKKMHNFKCTHMWWLPACLFLRCMKRQRASCPCPHRGPHLHVLTTDSLLCVPAEAWVTLNSTLWSPNPSLNSHWPNTHTHTHTHTPSLQPHILSSCSVWEATSFRQWSCESVTQNTWISSAFPKVDVWRDTLRMMCQTVPLLLIRH